MAWDPTLYSAFAEPRLRPALDLIGRIGAERPARVADLGCGTGNVTRLLAERWPEAAVSGIDSSPEMLAAAAREAPGLAWVEADIASWQAPQPLDVLFSNAALHWLDDHPALFRRLARMVRPGGWLAVQMPRNHHAPTHTCMIEAAMSGPWAPTLVPLLRRSPVAPPEDYYAILAPLAGDLDIWECDYLHVLSGDNPVARWTQSTALRPLLDALTEPLRGQFLVAYAHRIRAAYPPRVDGRTLLPFRRLFAVARIR